MPNSTGSQSGSNTPDQNPNVQVIADSTFSVLLKTIPPFSGDKNSILYSIFKRSVEALSKRCTAEQQNMLLSYLYTVIGGSAMRSIRSRDIQSIDALIKLLDELYGTNRRTGNTIFDMFNIPFDNFKNCRQLYENIADMKEDVSPYFLSKASTDDQRKYAIEMLEVMAIE